MAATWLMNSQSISSTTMFLFGVARTSSVEFVAIRQHLSSARGTHYIRTTNSTAAVRNRQVPVGQ
jgi:hypothetical protein